MIIILITRKMKRSGKGTYFETYRVLIVDRHIITVVTGDLQSFDCRQVYNNCGYCGYLRLTEF